ncbi:MAG: hypothetical protein KC636_05000 [Myxococcales bacterium]|nr:hypothetical protein [Myxococcales bacterium]
MHSIIAGLVGPWILAAGLVTAEPAAAPAGAAAQPEYAPVVGVSREDKEKAAMLEEAVAHKVARDYEHIVWAYGVLWGLFALYGVYLWRRGARLRADVDELRKAIDARGKA